MARRYKIHNKLNRQNDFENNFVSIMYVGEKNNIDKYRIKIKLNAKIIKKVNNTSNKSH